MAHLTKEDIRIVLDTIQEVYLADKIPWICGYSGGKDSTAVVQLVWLALSQLPEDKLHKPVHVISTDTLVESPVVALWAARSIARMKEAANNPEHKLPIIPHRLVPEVTNTFWVNLIGRGYPYPRRDFRWCTDRMKIDPSNRFVKKILDAESEAILVLGTRKAESATRKPSWRVMRKSDTAIILAPTDRFQTPMFLLLLKTGATTTSGNILYNTLTPGDIPTRTCWQCTAAPLRMASVRWCWIHLLPAAATVVSVVGYVLWFPRINPWRP